MASSEVDQKFLGHFAKATGQSNAFLSSFLFRVLGLSVVLSEKLLRARRTKRLDPVRDPQSRKLVHHILWLAKEGLVMVEQYVLPMVGNYVELKVLAYKLRASFYHIFVLFHNEPAVNRRTASASGVSAQYSLFPSPLSPRGAKSTPATTLTPPGQRSRASTTGSYSVGGAVSAPPGLPLPQIPRATNSASYLLPLLDYTPNATSCFVAASNLADQLLPGSHPLRLSVKVEYCAYLYDCLNDGEGSRRLARKTVREVYEAKEGMDDESFEDAAEMVAVLGRMMRRGLGGGSGSGSGSGSQGLISPPQQPRVPQQTRSPGRSRQGSATGSRSSPGRTGGGGVSTSQTRSGDSGYGSRTTAGSVGGGGGGGGVSRREKHRSRRRVTEPTQATVAPTTWV